MLGKKIWDPISNLNNMNKKYNNNKLKKNKKWQ